MALPPPPPLPPFHPYQSSHFPTFPSIPPPPPPPYNPKTQPLAFTSCLQNPPPYQPYSPCPFPLPERPSFNPIPPPPPIPPIALKPANNHTSHPIIRNGKATTGISSGKVSFRVDAKSFSLAFAGGRFDPYQIIKTHGKFRGSLWLGIDGLRWVLGVFTTIKVQSRMVFSGSS